MKQENATIKRQTPNAKRQTPNAKPFFARLKARLKKIALIYYPVHYVNVAVRYVFSFIRWQLYKHTVKFNRSGLNTTEKRSRRIIASLTSYPARIEIVPYVIASILNQTMKPDKIILWLGAEKFPDKKLPKIFDVLRECGVDIEFREDVGPLTKYFYAGQEYPDDIIITFDDDIVYKNFIIETLYKSYLEHPDCVSAMWISKIAFEPDGNIASYREWKTAYCMNKKGKPSHTFFALGVAGALYPPHAVHTEAFNIDIIRKFSLVTDDIWWKIMEVMNNTKVVSAYNDNKIPGWDAFGSQATAMWRINIIGGNNDREIKIMLDIYSSWHDNDAKTLLDIIREG